VRPEKVGSRPVSRVLSRTVIPLGRTSPCASSNLPGSPRGPRVAGEPACFPIWSCSEWGLPCREPLPAARCALTAPFHPCRRCPEAALGRYVFCGTFRGLAPPRRYLAPCPVEPGLSSPASDCPADSRGHSTLRVDRGGAPPVDRGGAPSWAPLAPEIFMSLRGAHDVPPLLPPCRWQGGRRDGPLPRSSRPKPQLANRLARALVTSPAGPAGPWPAIAETRP